ncbi:autotransporter domain-containing protein [Chlamydiifrater phoenicopteri]|uniref:autotransporter domain-containing protein n=1 Tax=Chlamydiifrater phoenicopteri TaxID=2681469 RepID=UPI001BCB7FE2|nr:autotransporter domain-containing protein [Chlamydiifrater phoenicopteri]
MKNRYISSFSQSVILAIIASSSLQASASYLEEKEFVASHFLHPFSQECFENYRYFSTQVGAQGTEDKSSETPSSDASDQENTESSLDGKSESEPKSEITEPAAPSNGAEKEAPVAPAAPVKEEEKVVIAEPTPATEAASPCFKTETLTSGGKTPASADDLTGFQHCSEGNVLYEVLGGLSWKNVDASSVGEVAAENELDSSNAQQEEAQSGEQGQGDTGSPIGEESSIGSGSQEGGDENQNGESLTDESLRREGENHDSGSGQSDKGDEPSNVVTEGAVAESGIDSNREAAEINPLSAVALRDYSLESVSTVNEKCNKEHGLAFCNTKVSQQGLEGRQEQSACPVNGITFSGVGKSDGLLFSNLKTKKSGAAIYSESDVVFENLQRGLTFSDCESSESGGAVAANNITVKNCNGVTLTNNKTTVPSDVDSSAGDSGGESVLLSVAEGGSSTQDNLNMGGGAFWAGEPTSSSDAGTVGFQGGDGSTTQPKSGSIQFVGNTGVILISQNSSTVNGGAMAAKSITFDSNVGSVEFSANAASFSGGALSSTDSITFLNNKSGIVFSGNSACKQPGAVSTGLVEGLAKTVSSGDSAEVIKGSGGAIASNGTVTFSKNSGEISFLGNKVGESNADAERTSGDSSVQLLGKGGAISSKKCSFESNLGKISFSSNSTSDSGGAIFVSENIEGKNNLGRIEFIDNKADGSGGALYCYKDSSLANETNLELSTEETETISGQVTFSSNAEGVLFSGNSSKKDGGAIYAQGVSFSGNSGIAFLKNTSASSGGAICCKYSLSEPGSELSVSEEGPQKCEINISRNSGSTVFEGNSVSLPEQVMNKASGDVFGGGAIFGKSISIDSNIGTCLFERNSFSSERSGLDKVFGGGGIFGDTVTVSKNLGGVAFSNNSVSGKISTTPSSPEELQIMTNPKEIEPSSPTLAAIQSAFGGGAIFTGSLTFSGNKGDSSFSNNQVSVEETEGGNSVSSQVCYGGGAILAKEKVSLTGNERIAFVYNVALGKNSSGGAVFSKDVTLTGNQNIIFDGNSSESKGGGIYSKNGCVSITNNSSVVFTNNHAQESGGAIFIESVTSSTEGPGAEEEDSDQGQLGALNSDASDKFSIIGNYGQVLFSNNYTTTAFPASENDGEALSGASSEKYGGGAAYVKDIEVSGNRDVLFLFNKADKGGAIHIKDGGSVSLSADYGNIVFQGNKELDGTSDCIFLAGSTSKITKLRAREGHAVQFFDSIIFDNETSRDTVSTQVVNSTVASTQTPSLSINGADNGMVRQNSENPYIGVVQFGGGISKIPQKAKLEAGGLIVSGGELWLEGLEQTQGSYIQLSADTVFGQLKQSTETGSTTSSGSSSGSPSSLQSLGATYAGHGKPRLNKNMSIDPKNSSTFSDGSSGEVSLGSGFKITEIRVDLSSFNKNSKAPKFVIVPSGNGGGSAALNADGSNSELKVVLVDSSGTAMEKHDLFASDSQISFIDFMEEKNGKLEPVSSTNGENGALGFSKVAFSLGEGLDGNFYGHQGSWSASLANGAVTANWTKTGYSLDPKTDGAVVVNGLWSQYTDVRGIKGQIFHNHVTDQRMEMDFFTNVWGSGLGQFVNSVAVGDIDGFVHRTGGYVLGMDTEIIQDFLIGGSFAQTFGYTDSRRHNIRCSERGYIGSVYAGISHYGKGSGTWMFKGAVLYGNINNDMTSRYTGELGVSKGAWADHSLLASVRVDRKKFSNSRSFSSAMISAWAPFVEVEYAFIDQMPFLEVGGSQVRDFEKGKLQNLAVPVGITFENFYSKGARSESLSFAIAYSPDAYRKNPKGSATIVNAKHSWITRGCKWPRHAVRCRLDNNTEWNESLGTYMSFEYEGRKHVASYNFSGGARLIF